ncbi:MAG: threonine--tRNA ligase [Candidatus Omnitrophica bacterium]|nr:threonine--tRNA ligase [Candidatus Omnitrophota bacterium]MDD5351598.1 threonine--tRNA ligase [Candidatus Omnitrophota bacterium]MDD5550807.1 threonine--tRNA ligase [Candidatus Omnitrophota bacterium]
MAELNLDTLRHSCSHVMAEAVKELWPNVKLGIGPSIEDGFYYDFDKPADAQGKKDLFSPEDLTKIEAKMREIIARNEPFVQEQIPKAQAQELFKNAGENYKLELLNELTDGTISVYKTGDKFVDLCKGPHIDSTGQIKAFKLLSVAGAYWRGTETNPMLQRIYGTAFFTKQELDEHLKRIEEAVKRDHRKLGKELKYFDIYYEQAGTGLIFYHPKGAILRSIIEDYEKKEHAKRGYQLVVTPHIMKQDLWITSGHYDYYRENMFTMQVEDKEYVLKPMNCPGHMLIYKSQTRSYKDLPIRYFELGTVYRYEKSGVLHGLLRVRGFTQDDAHIFCLPEQLKYEIKGVLDFVFDTMKFFGFDDFSIELSTRPAKSIGSDADWEKAQAALEGVLKEKNLHYKINPGEGAFYGPKVDIKLKDALKREWQCATIQCDFTLPERFKLEYIGSDGKTYRPIMLHRVILGSIERFIGTLLEHYAGALPFWLSPVQVLILPVKDAFFAYAKEIKETLEKNNLRISIDLRSETLDKKIREAELQKIPYVIVIGEREFKASSISVRKRSVGDQGQIELFNFIQKLKEECQGHELALLKG